MEEITLGQALIFGGLCGCGYLLYRVFGLLGQIADMVEACIDMYYSEITERRR